MFLYVNLRLAMMVDYPKKKKRSNRIRLTRKQLILISIICIVIIITIYAISFYIIFLPVELSPEMRELIYDVCFAGPCGDT